MFNFSFWFGSWAHFRLCFIYIHVLFYLCFHFIIHFIWVLLLLLFYFILVFITSLFLSPIFSKPNSQNPKYAIKPHHLIICPNQSPQNPMHYLTLNKSSLAQIYLTFYPSHQNKSPSPRPIFKHTSPISPYKST